MRAIDRTNPPTLAERAGPRERYDAPTESTPGHASTVDAGSFGERLHRGVHHRRRGLVEVTKAVVAGNHEIARCLEVAGRERVGELSHALILTDHVPCARPNDR